MVGCCRFQIIVSEEWQIKWRDLQLYWLYNSQLLNARSQKAVFFQSYLSSLACRNLGSKYKRTVEFQIHIATKVYNGLSYNSCRKAFNSCIKYTVLLRLVEIYLFINPGLKTRTGCSPHMHREGQPSKCLWPSQWLFTFLLSIWENNLKNCKFKLLLLISNGNNTLGKTLGTLTDLCWWRKIYGLRYNLASLL